MQKRDIRYAAGFCSALLYAIYTPTTDAMTMYHLRLVKPLAMGIAHDLTAIDLSHSTRLLCNIWDGSGSIDNIQIGQPLLQNLDLLGQKDNTKIFGTRLRKLIDNHNKECKSSGCKHWQGNWFTECQQTVEAISCSARLTEAQSSAEMITLNFGSNSIELPLFPHRTRFRRLYNMKHTNGPVLSY